MDRTHAASTVRVAVGHAARTRVTRAAVVRVVCCVDLATVAKRTIAISVAVGEIALARRDDADTQVAATRGGLGDHAGPATVGVAAKIGVRARDAHPIARLAIGRAALLQGVGGHDQRTGMQSTEQQREENAYQTLEQSLPGPPTRHSGRTLACAGAGCGGRVKAMAKRRWFWPRGRGTPKAC